MILRCGVGGWVGGWVSEWWVVEKVEENEAVGMSCCLLGLSRWVGR